MTTYAISKANGWAYASVKKRVRLLKDDSVPPPVAHRKMSKEDLANRKQHVRENPKTSCAKVAKATGVSSSWACRFLHRVWKKKAAKQIRTPRLTPDQKKTRLVYCQGMLMRLATSKGRRVRGKSVAPLDLSKVLFADEKAFRYEGLSGQWLTVTAKTLVSG